MTIRLLRFAFRVWPFMHGRGWILRLARLLLGHDPIRFDIGGGVLIEGSLDDWIIVWTFMRRHEADASFQRSFDFLPDGGVAIDVGAHIGIWSLLAARRAPHARIHAFEPVPRQAARLRAHIALNRAERIVVNECAVGAENGSAAFYAVYEENSGASSLVRRAEPHVELRVDVITLDSYIDRADLLKVDVEGAEHLVFRGASALLASENAPAIFFEIDEKLCASFGVTTRQVKQLLVDHGYAIYRWQHSRFVAVAIDEPHPHEDLFALKPRHVRQIRHS
jgi:FkbM family methyltransferase